MRRRYLAPLACMSLVLWDWIGYLLSAEQTTTQAHLLFADALADQGLLGPTASRLTATGRSSSPGQTTAPR